MKLPHAAFRSKLAIALLCSSLFMALYTGLVSYHLATSEFRQMSSQLTEDSVQMADTLLSDYLYNLQTHSTKLLNSTPLRSLSKKSSMTLSDYSEYSSSVSISIRVGVAEAMRHGVNFQSVDVYLLNGYQYSTGTNPMYENYADCLNAISDQGLQTSAGYIRTQWGLCQPPGESRPFLACIRFMYDASAQKNGVAVFTIHNKDLTSIYSSLDSAYISSRQGVIFSAANHARIGTDIDNQTLLENMNNKPSGGTVTYRDSNKGEVLAAYRPIMNQDAFLVVPFEAYSTILQTELAGYIHSIILMAFVGILFSLLITLLLSDSLSKSVLSLTTFLKKVGDDSQSSLRYHPKSRDEIAEIGEKVNELIDRLQIAAETLESDLQSKQMLEISLLRSHINPHLLYNTLDSVLWNLQNQDTADATTLIASLSEYFKLSLSSGRHIIALSEELNLIGHYLEIQRLARHKPITLVLNIPQELYSHPLLKLTLQPIVENAILHGFNGYRDNGVITISAVRDLPYLRLCVRDNGIGILDEELKALNKDLCTYPPSPTQLSFGLYNINRTILQTYGAGCGLLISSEISEYTCVTVTIPYHATEIIKGDDHV